MSVVPDPVQHKNPFTIKKISPMAKVIDDYTTEAKSKNTINAFGAADITKARISMRAHKDKTGEAISFTAFLIACYARIVEKHKYPINTLRKRKSEYYIFDEVDVATNIERNIDGVKKPVNYTVRNAHTKNLRQIHTEIREAQAGKVKLTTGNEGKSKLLKIFPKLPRFIRKIIIHQIFIHPLQKKNLLGTVGLTAAGMMGKETNELGWAVFMTPHTSALGIGSIAKEYKLTKEGKTEERESLAVTYAFDHAVVDGGPAARFLADLYSMLREGCIEADWCFKSL